MKIYEGMFLVDTKEARKSSASVEEHIRNLVAKCGGEIKVFDKWDERKLAYEIKGTRNGTYYLTYFTGVEDTVSRLYRECELSPVLLRALFLRVKKVPEPKREEPEQPPAAEEAGEKHAGKAEAEKPEAAEPEAAQQAKAETAEPASPPAAEAEAARPADADAAAAGSAAEAPAAEEGVEKEG